MKEQDSGVRIQESGEKKKNPDLGRPPAPPAPTAEGALTDEQKFLASGAKIQSKHKRDWENVYRTKDGGKVRFDPKSGARL